MISVLRSASQDATMPTGPSPQQWQETTLHTTADMNVVNERILGEMIAAGFGEKDLFSMRLALEETIVNAIKHGNAGDTSKAVRVNYCVAPDRVRVEIEDEGPGFDPAKIPDPLAPENIERPSGRGLFLIRYYMSSVTFNDCGNRVILSKDKSSV
jgi:serine/threonine-protein kinase RsbW